MDLPALQARLEVMAGCPVVAVGDIMLDRFVGGEVTRVSAEAPTPILALGEEASMLGAAGNVAHNLAALGARAALAGVVGVDAAAAEVRALTERAKLRANLIPDASRPTTTKVRYVSAGQQLLRVDREVLAPVAGAVEEALVAAIGGFAGEARAILLSDYGKGAVTPRVVAACREAARSTGALLIVDSKARHFHLYGEADVVKPNAAELAFATGMPTATDAEVESALAHALEGNPCRAILVTRAANGMSLAERSKAVRHFRRPPPEVFDTAGAGDTALAALGLALASGASLEEASELALIASGVAVQKAGVATVLADEVLEAELAAQLAPSEAKIVTSEGMARAAARWRGGGLKVGFTNGCFDILHPGHVAYLNQARTWCDRLIVGLNTDASVRQAKGAGRPVNPLEARAVVLAALTCVDLVVPFDAPTPIALIGAARPDVLVKGGDYDLAGIVGADLVKSWGGDVRIADFIEGHSTTATLARVGKP